MRVVRDAGRLSVVDGVSSVSSMPVDVDRVGADVVVSGSQKGWMAPPGVAFVSVSQAAWERQARARSPRFYFDWDQHRRFLVQGATPWTPAISVLFGVREGIRMLLEEGLDNTYARHRRCADATAAGLSGMGFTLFAAEGHRSATVTAALPPDGLDIKAYRKLLRERFGVVIAGGQGKMSRQMIRVGHLGAVSQGYAVRVLCSLEQALAELGDARAGTREPDSGEVSDLRDRWDDMTPEERRDTLADRDVADQEDDGEHGEDQIAEAHRRSTSRTIPSIAASRCSLERLRSFGPSAIA